MASYKFKVIKGGKVIGEATTRAEAEAAAKKHGGHVAEILAGKTGSAGRRGNPPPEPHGAAVPGQALPHPRALADCKRSFWSKDGRFAIYRGGDGAVNLADVQAGKTIASSDLDGYAYATERPARSWDVAKPSFSDGFIEAPANLLHEWAWARARNPKPKTKRTRNASQPSSERTVSGGPPGWQLPAKHTVRIHFDNGKTAERDVFAYSERAAVAMYLGKAYEGAGASWPEVGDDPVTVAAVEIVKKPNPKSKKAPAKAKTSKSKPTTTKASGRKIQYV